MFILYFNDNTDGELPTPNPTVCFSRCFVFHLELYEHVSKKLTSLLPVTEKCFHYNSCNLKNLCKDKYAQMHQAEPLI